MVTRKRRVFEFLVSPWVGLAYTFSSAFLYVLVKSCVSFDSVELAEQGSVGPFELMMALSIGQSPTEFGSFLEQSKVAEVYAWIHAFGAWLILPVFIGYLVSKTRSRIEQQVFDLRVAEQDILVAKALGIKPETIEAARLGAQERLKTTNGPQ